MAVAASETNGKGRSDRRLRDTLAGLQGFLGAIGKLGGTAGRLVDLGWGSASNFFGSHNWDNNNDISQVGSQY